MFDKKHFIDFAKSMSKTHDLRKSRIGNYIYIGHRLTITELKNILKEVIDLDLSEGLFLIKKGKHLTKVKPGKLVKKILDLPEHYNIGKTEYITNLVKSYILSINNKITFKVISGKKSPDFFHQNSKIKQGNHTLSFDCMKNKECQKYFGIFRENPDKIKVLYSFREGLKTNNSVSGFCVLFNVKGEIYYDKIYGYNLEDAILLESFCVKEKYKPLPYNKPLMLKLDNFTFNKYPYIDGFHYLTKDGLLINAQYSYKLEREGFLVDLHNTHGDYFI